MRIAVFLLLIVFPRHSLVAQEVLQLFTEVEGTQPDTYLGLNVHGIEPTGNVPYNLAVSRWHGVFQRLEFHMVEAPEDTAILRKLPGNTMVLGDLNEDGFTDIVTRIDYGAYDTILVFWGTPEWVDTLSPMVIPGDYHDDLVRPCIGDANNDGHADLVVLAPGYASGRGRFSIYYGPEISTEPDLEVVGDTTQSAFSGSFFLADLNDDGLTDIVVGGLEYAHAIDTAYVKIYWACRPDTVCLDNFTSMRIGITRWEGMSVFDVNGDGIEDLLWGRNETGASGQVFIYYGGSDFDTVPDMALMDPAPLSFSHIGSAGDLNGDGFDDIIGSVPSADFVNGFVFVYGGGPEIDPYFDAAVGRGLDGHFGWSFSPVGDVNGDGVGDLVVSAPWADWIQARGYWGIFLGDEEILVSDVEEGHTVPRIARLYHAYPNPFNPSTTFSFSIPQSSIVTLTVFDLLGREVATVVNERLPAGTYTEQWDAAGLPSGVYFYRLMAGEFVETKKLVLVR